METMSQTHQNDIKKMHASKNPKKDIDKISYPGQPNVMKMYRKGFEQFMDAMPVIEENHSLKFSIDVTKTIMKHLSKAIFKDKFLLRVKVQDNKFKRTIVGLETPLEKSNGEFIPGSELVVAHWGKGFTSPIHGHATGFLYEEVLSGRIKVNNYFISDEEKRIVRPSHIEIVSPGVFVSDYAPATDHVNKRRTLVHNFEALEPSNTLHYLPEHTRDGMDNTFTLEQWSELSSSDVTQISSKDGLGLKTGSVVLVRSLNVPEYGDHFIIITGPPVTKEHGIRPQDISIMASSQHTEILNKFPLTMGLTLLKLSDEAAQKFHEFHNTTKYIKK